MGDAPGKHQLNTRIDERLHSRLLAATCLRGRDDCPSRTAAVEEALAEWLDRREQQMAAAAR